MERSFTGPPPPVIELTMEQEFKLRQVNDLLQKADKDDIITVFMALQRQNLCLTNTLNNLLKEWPRIPSTTPEEPSKYGISFETKN